MILPLDAAPKVCRSVMQFRVLSSHGGPYASLHLCRAWFGDIREKFAEPPRRMDRAGRRIKTDTGDLPKPKMDDAAGG